MLCWGRSSNFDDPLGKEWNARRRAGGMVILQPGQTVEWKVRLEIFPVTKT